MGDTREVEAARRQEFEIEWELRLGFPRGKRPSVFATEEERRRAWEERRAHLLAHASMGRRPHAFWEFEIGERPDDDVHRYELLKAGGHLTDEEERWYEPRLARLDDFQERIERAGESFDGPRSVHLGLAQWEPVVTIFESDDWMGPCRVYQPRGDGDIEVTELDSSDVVTACRVVPTGR
jgi:hypothetical protein